MYGVFNFRFVVRVGCHYYCNGCGPDDVPSLNIEGVGGRWASFTFWRFVMAETFRIGGDELGFGDEYHGLTFLPSPFILWIMGLSIRQVVFLQVFRRECWLVADFC